MGMTYTWTGSGNMDFYYGDGSDQGSTTLVGSHYEWNETRYGQVLWFTTDSVGGVGFTFDWKPVAFTGSDKTVYLRISTTRKDGCTNTSSNALSYTTISGGYRFSDNTTIFQPNTTYYIYINRSAYTYGYHHYASNNSGWGTSTITLKGALSYTLNLNAGSNSSITVTRTSSPSGGASTGALSNGAKIYHNDVLKITYGASEGYDLSTHTVNGTTFASGGTITVTSNVSVASTASIKSYTLSMSVGNGASLTVTRTSSPIASASTGVLSNGSTIYYNDVLKITVTLNNGYQVGTQFINGASFNSGATHTVKSAVNIIVTAFKKRTPRWACYVDNGSSYVKRKCYIDDGSNHTPYSCHIDNGTEW